MLTASVAQITRSTLEPKDHWHTPREVLDIIREIHGGTIPLDVCSDSTNPTEAEAFYTPEVDGLSQPWNRGWFGNIPFSNKPQWIERAAEQSKVWRVSGIMIAPDPILQNKGTRMIARQCNGFACLGRVRFQPGPALVAARLEQLAKEDDEIARGARVKRSFKDAIPASPPDNIVALHYGPNFSQFQSVFERLGFPVYTSS